MSGKIPLPCQYRSEIPQTDCRPLLLTVSSGAAHERHCFAHVDWYQLCGHMAMSVAGRKLYPGHHQLHMKQATMHKQALRLCVHRVVPVPQCVAPACMILYHVVHMKPPPTTLPSLVRAYPKPYLPLQGLCRDEPGRIGSWYNKLMRRDLFTPRRVKTVSGVQVQEGQALSQEKAGTVHGSGRCLPTS